MKKHIGLITLLIMIVVLFCSCEQAVETTTSFDTPTAIGRVVLPDGVSIPYESIFIKVVETGNVYAVNADGTYVIPNLEANKKYSLLFQNKDFSSNTRGLGIDIDDLEDLEDIKNIISKLIAGKKDNVQGAIGTGFDNGVTVMKKTAAIAGKVTLNGANNSLGIDVFIPGTSFGAKTKADGSFRITGIMEGNDYTLAYMYPGYISVESDPFNVSIDENGNNIFTIEKDVVLTKYSGTATGSVRIQGDVIDETLFDSITVSITNQKNPAKNYTTPIVNGDFQKEGIEPGIYKVEVSLNGYRKGVSESIEIVEGKVANFGEISLVPYGKKITGNVVLQGLSDAAGISILATNTEKKVRYSTVTDTGGSFSLDNCIPGEYVIQYAKTGYGTEKKTVVVDDNTLVPDCSMKKQFEIILKNDSDIQIMHLNYGSVFTVPAYETPGYVAKIKNSAGEYVKPGDDIIVKSDMEFTWEWVKGCVVSFVNTDLKPMLVAQGETIKIPNITKSGFVVNSISLASGKELNVNEDLIVDTDLTITWDWLKVYTINFSGITRDPETYAEGSLFTVPEIENTGFVVGKIVDSNGVELKAGDKFTVTSDLRLTWHWADAYVISFNGVNKPDAIVKAGGTFTVPFIENEGFVLVDIKDGLGNTYKAGDPIKVNGDKILTWTWKKLYNIEFVGADLTGERVVEGNTYRVPDVSNMDHELVSITDQTGKVWKVGELITIDKDFTLTYEWVRLYDVSFTGIDKTTVKVRAGETFTIPLAEKSGYEADVYMGANKVAVGEEVVITGNTNIAWNWYKLHKITFIGVDQLPVYIRENSVYEVPAVDKGGYVLKSITDGVGKSYESGNRITIGSDITLTWTWSKSFTVDFVGIFREPEIVEIGSEYIVPEITVDGLTAVITDGASNVKHAGDRIIINGDVTLTWTWNGVTPTDEFTYMDNGSGITITGYEGISKNLVLPFIIDGKPVTEIGTNAFAGYIDIISIRMPSTLKHVNRGAFARCSGLNDITLNEGLLSIDDNAFEDCKKLTTLHLPSTLQDIGNATFKGCTGITSIAIPKSVQNVGTNAFAAWTPKQTITFDKGVNSTGWNSNWKTECSAIILEDFLYEVYSDRAVITGYTGSKNNITLPAEIAGQPVKEIANNAFKGKNFLYSVVIPESVERIGWRAFQGCTSINILHIPYSVVDVGERAFLGWGSNQTIEIESVYMTRKWSINWNEGCSSMYKTDFIYNSEGVISKYCGRNVEHLIIPASILGTPIKGVRPEGNDNLFGYLYDDKTGRLSVKSIEIEEGIETLYGGVFSNCSNLTEVKLPSTLKKLDGYYEPYYMMDMMPGAFANCNISSITLPENLEQIGPCAFSGNPLPTITIPASVRDIGPEAFSKNTNIIISPDNPKFEIITGCLIDKVSNRLISIRNSDFTIPANGVVETISANAFQRSSITSIVIPEGVKCLEGDSHGSCGMGNGVFSECRSLSHVELPSTLETIGDGVFFNCSSLKSITLPANLQKIGNSAFWGAGIQEIIVPDKVTNIDHYAFDYTELVSLTIPKSVKYVGYICQHCDSLEEIRVQKGTDMSNWEKDWNRHYNYNSNKYNNISVVYYY